MMMTRRRIMLILSYCSRTVSRVGLSHAGVQNFANLARPQSYNYYGDEGDDDKEEENEDLAYCIRTSREGLLHAGGAGRAYARGG